MIELVIVGVGRVDYGLLVEVSGYVKDKFPIDVEVYLPVWREQLPLVLFDFERGQYRASQVNRFLYDRFKSIIIPGRRVLVGIVNGDGYAKNLNFVFGLASRKLGVATIYTKRILGDRFKERLVKLILHETGHLLGLGHCTNPRCVMRFSNSLAELDAKGDRFCSSCEMKLRGLTGDG